MGVICKYKYDSSMYADLIPEFNSELDVLTTRTVNSPGTLKTGAIPASSVDTATANSKYWNVEGTVAIYTFNSGTDTLPAFNSGFIYAYTDVDNGDDTITRTITSDSSPSSISFEDESDLISLSYLDISNVADMSYMFYGCYELTSIDVSDWDTSNVTDMSYIFSGCYNLTSLDVSNWKTGKVIDMSYMFDSCEKLTSIDVSNWDTSKVTNMSFMFSYCYGLTSIDVSNWDTGNVTDMSYIFSGCDKLTSIDISNWDTGNVTDMNSMFSNCGFTSLNVGKFDTSKVTDMSYMFQGCTELTTLDLSSFDTSKVTNMSFMFYNCDGLTSLNVSSFDTNKVTNMSYMFSNCESLTSLDVSSFDTSKVTSMTQMFSYCKSLTSLDVSSFDTSKVTSMTQMFEVCTNLTSLDLSNFDTSEVTTMIRMFYECNSLTTLDVSNFDTSNVTNTTNMFANTNSLEVITMFNNDINTINVVGNLTSATIYVDESLDQSQYTGTAPLKVYKEEKIEIKLNSPLLEGDTIEVVDGKLCHVHRWDKVVLDGSEDWKQYNDNQVNNIGFYFKHYLNTVAHTCYCSSIRPSVSDYMSGELKNDRQGIFFHYQYIKLSINKSKLLTQNVDGFKQWLSQNPLTIIYKLKEPIYEDITPLQSSIILKTFLESSMTIDTILPIETKLSYRTNVPSISTLSTRATELAESDNVIHNLMNIIDDEVDE